MPTPSPLWPDRDPSQDDGQTPTLTPYLLEDRRDAPLVMVLPGGGYNHLADHEGQPLARIMNDHGMHAAVLHYRLNPNRHPKMIHDAQRAIRLIRANADAWGVDPQAIGVLGFSAGGHLASTLTVHYDRFTNEDDDLRHITARPDAAVLCYAVIDLDEYAHKGSRQCLLGRPPDPDLVHLLSNHRHVDARTPPCFLWHTAADGGVHMNNSLQFAMACKTHEVPVELHVYERGGHGVGLATDMPDVRTWIDHCLAFLQRHLVPNPVHAD